MVKNLQKLGSVAVPQTVRNFAHCAPACKGVPTHSHPHPPHSRLRPSLPLYFSDSERYANLSQRGRGVNCVNLATWHPSYRESVSRSPRKRTLRFPWPFGLQRFHYGGLKIQHSRLMCIFFFLLLRSGLSKSFSLKEPNRVGERHGISGGSSTPPKARARPGGRLAGLRAAGRSGWIM